MTGWTLVLQGLRFHWRSHLAAAVGVAVAGAVLTGALLVGDSLRHSLRGLALARLGRVQLALDARERPFREELAAEVAAALGVDACPVLRLRATAARADGEARVARVEALGVDSRFARLASGGAAFDNLGVDAAVVNARLAAALGIGPGDAFVLRVQRLSPLPGDTPLAKDDKDALALRVTVAAVARDDALGNFDLRASPTPPANAFLSLPWLQEKLKLAGRANLLLTGGGSAAATIAAAKDALRARWRPADAGLSLEEPPGAGVLQLQTDRIFLEAAVARAAVGVAPDALGVLGYFVNEIRAGDRATPYSMVAAVGPASGDAGATSPRFLPGDLGDEEAVINEWLAEDLAVTAGDSLDMKFFVLGPARRFEERQARFRVRAVTRIEGAAADRAWSPRFPGLSEAANCRDWEPGMPIRLDRIRKKDEAYWTAHRETPKAFVTLRAGRKLWANRFGDLTALRFSRTEGRTREALEAALTRALDPAALGLAFRAVREEALAAADPPMDFGQLFLGLSFFLIVAAALLAGLLFRFGLERRSEEVGTLLALGYSPERVRGLFLREGALVAVAGGLVGAAGGAAYTRAVLHGLSTLWRDAVGGAGSLVFHGEPVSLAIGCLSAVALAWSVFAAGIRGCARSPARELLAVGAGGGGLSAEALPKAGSRMFAPALTAAIGAGLGALALLFFAAKAGGGSGAAGAFFGAGALLLTSGLLLGHALLTGFAAAGRAEGRLSLAGLGVRNCARRRGRSLATAGLLACGAFLVTAVGANRHDPAADASRREGGTGGFALYGESALPVLRDLNAEDGRAAYALDPAALDGVSVVPLRVHDGDDASCLNPNRAVRPRLLGASPEALSARGAFSFAEHAPDPGVANPWLLLGRRSPEDPVPAIADAATIQWALRKSLGECVACEDERGRVVQLRLVGGLDGSILQGSLLIAERDFEALFPSESGYRAFLVDAPVDRAAAVARAFARALADLGLDIGPAAERVAAFHAVENTYLSVLLVLGGLALLLGTVGLGVVVLRNLLERRAELAVLRALGLGTGHLLRMIGAEHGLLLAGGLACGAVAAAVSVWPAVRVPQASAPLGLAAGTFLAVAGSGTVWMLMAILWTVRSSVAAALRDE